jgi:ABC-type multidrug transport system ATPase subunit
LQILDEPTEGIQRDIVHEIGEIILKLNKAEGLTVLLVEQKLPFARRVASEFCILSNGRRVAAGRIEHLTDQVVRAHLSVWLLLLLHFSYLTFLTLPKTINQEVNRLGVSNNKNGDSSETRQSVVNQPEIRERIAIRAYELHEIRGGMPGNEVEDWLRAESEIVTALTRPDTTTTTEVDGEVKPAKKPSKPAAVRKRVSPSRP